MPPKITAFHHVSIVCADLARAKTFYSSVLGLSSLPLPSPDLEGRILWFDLGDNQALHILKGTPNPNGMAHFALRIQTLAPWINHLKTCGVQIDAPDVQLAGKKRVFIKDPDGNPIELSQ